MKWRHVVLIVLGIGASTGLYVTAPFPDSADAPLLVLMEAYAPILLMGIHAGYFAMPGVLLAIGGMLLLGVWRVWFEQMPDKKPVKGGLPDWPVSDADDELGLVVGELHHPVEAREISNPKWLVIPERGLFTGLAIFGAVTSAAAVRVFDRMVAGFYSFWAV